MFDWLFEGRAIIYCLLGALAVVCAAAWWMTRKRGLLIGVGVLAGLAGVYFLLSLVKETPRVQIERKLQEMAAGVKARDTDAIFRHIAADFRFRGQDRTTFRALVDRALRQGLIDDLGVKDFDWPDGGDDYRRPVEFIAQPHGVMPEPSVYRIRATFVREQDGEWRMQTFDVFPYIGDTSRPIDLPGLP